MGCMEKNEGTITSEAEKLKFDKLFAKLKQNHPEATFTLISNNSTEIRESSDCRPEEEEECDEYLISGYSVDVNGCPIIVSAKVKVCEDENELVTLVAFWDFTWSFTSDPDCWSFRLDMSDHYINGRYSALQNDMEAFYRLLTRTFEEDYLANLVLDIPLCSSFGYSNIAHFYEDECQQFRAELSTYEGDIYYNITFVKCGDACCLRTTPYCKDNNGDPQSGLVQTYVIGDEECDPVTIICNGIQVPSVTCNHPCDRL